MRLSLRFVLSLVSLRRRVFRSGGRKKRGAPKGAVQVGRNAPVSGRDGPTP